jgi:hypothetical protein
MRAIRRLDFTCIVFNIRVLLSGPTDPSATTIKFTRSDKLGQSLIKTIRQAFPEVKRGLCREFST